MSGAPPSRLRSLLAALLLFGLVAVAMYWPLPNNPGLSRVDLLQNAEDLLGGFFTHPKTGLLANAAGWGDRLVPLALALLTWFGGWGLGNLLLRPIPTGTTRHSLPRFLLACGVGLGVWSLVVLGLGLRGTTC